jgi:hypothetical protein
MADATTPVPLEQTRQHVIQELCQHFAVDNLDGDGLADRLDKAQAATTLDGLRSLVSDLPALRAEGAATQSAGLPTVARADGVADQQLVIAIMGGARRTGVWTPPRQLNVITVMGGAELDFREARFGPGVTEVNVFALMGGVEIIVPPNLHLEVNGLAIMGGFDQRAHTLGHPTDPSAPVLRIGGFALMGGVDVKVRLPGEGAFDARRREKVARREIRRIKRGR